MVDELTKCPDCKGRTLVREGDELVCTICKGRFPAEAPAPDKKPPKRNRRYDNIKERHEYLEKNRDGIVRDLLTIGQSETCKKWDIPDSTIAGLKNRWLTAQQKAKVASLKPPPKPPQGNKETHDFFEKHRSEIIIDLLTFGRVGTRKKWEIKGHSTLFTLECRWLTPAQKARVDSLDPNPLRDSCIVLPDFPQFSNDWQPQVQVCWLELYSQLIGRDSRGQMPNEQDQIIEALTSLGTPKREAQRLANSIGNTHFGAPLEEKIKYAVQALGKT